MKEFKTGDRVRITAGQYKGMIGKLRGVSRDSGRCTVELDAGADPSLLDNCYFTSIVEIEHVPDDFVSKPAPKSFDDLDALAAKAKEEAKSQPKAAEPKRPLFARRNKVDKTKSTSSKSASDEAMDFEDIFIDDFAAASVDGRVVQEYSAPKEFNPEEFNPQAFEPISASEPASAPQPVPEPIPEPIPQPIPQPVPEPEPEVIPEPVSEPGPIISNPIPAAESSASVSASPIISEPLSSQESTEVHEESQPERERQLEQQKEMQQKSMDNQEFVPKFRQEIPKPQEFIPLPCRNCRLKDQRENCSPKEFSECQAAYAFDEYLKEHSVQLFVEQILIPEMNQLGVSETEKKAMLQRLLLEL